MTAKRTRTTRTTTATPPPRSGSRPAEIITSGFLVVAALLSWIAFFSVGFGDGEVQRIPVLNWFIVGHARRRLGASASTR